MQSMDSISWIAITERRQIVQLYTRYRVVHPCSWEPQHVHHLPHPRLRHLPHPRLRDAIKEKKSK